MNYRENYGKDKLSLLGFGCMRFPKKGNGFDTDEIEKEIAYAIEMGVNYFDTAYVYPGSEEALGKALEKCGCRDRINIASKMPHYLWNTIDDLEKRFNEQLRRLRTDHIDYYLMHMLPDVKTWENMVSKGILEWIAAKKEAGLIRRIGFSYHGASEMFISLLHAYSWDFCQMQYNYLDENSQAGRLGLCEAQKLQIPVIIMEPLRGGKLAVNLPKEAMEVFAATQKSWSPAEWGLRWLWNQSGISVVLSGMNSMEMLKENIRIASDSEAGMLTEEDATVYEKVRDILDQKIKVNCTGCRYCMPCPFGVDIPGAFRAYNNSYTEGFLTGVREYALCTSLKNEQSRVTQCKECGKCMTHCPQHINIPSELKKVKKRFEFPIYKLFVKLYPGKVK